MLYRIAGLFCCGLLLVSTARAELRTETVVYEDGDTALRGYLAWDDSFEGRRPGVLIVHEWWGLNDYVRSRAEQLAGLGYVAFALDLYGDGKVTEHASEASAWAQQVRANVDGWRRRAERGLEVLKQQPPCDRKRVAAIGYCLGGATVLQLAYGGTELAGVVSFHGALPVPTAEQAAAIKAPILICHGAADAFIPEEVIQQFRGALESADADWQMISYGNAKHSFTNPEADGVGMAGLAYDADADRRSWRHMQQFFDEVFGP